MRIDRDIVRNPATGKVNHSASADANFAAAKGTVDRAFSRDSATIPIVRVMVDVLDFGALPGAALDAGQGMAHKALAWLKGE